MFTIFPHHRVCLLYSHIIEYVYYISISSSVFTIFPHHRVCLLYFHYTECVYYFSTSPSVFTIFPHHRVCLLYFHITECVYYISTYIEYVYYISISYRVYIPTVPLSAGQSRFRTICPAFSISVPFAPIQRENVKKLTASIQNSYKIYSLNNDLINIKSSNIILLSLITSITIILSRQLI